MKSVVVHTSRDDMMRRWPALAVIFGSRGQYRVTATKLSGSRTLAQNRLYWACVEILADAIGFESKDSAHEMIMREAGFGKFITIKDKHYFARKSSASLTKDEFAALLEKCKEIAAFLNEDRDIESYIVLPIHELEIEKEKKND